ncbi:Glucose dehydrogenase [Eumeta japonica]|uniref:Glucose dehydrogenase n=1 Tax=Eumeta variegata TaxID=151549 RepID=A0A4C1W0E8_EUMVA|nr:Glucose dehydrogenase [Eumeta japonica]
MILVRIAIHWYRPDIEDIEHRVRARPFHQLNECYDFIIVGGGSAGCVLANRLSENSNWTVLLLEAGPDENVLSEVPVLFPVLQTSNIDWQFVTEPSESFCLSMIDKRCKWPRGKALGGSSVINAMLYIRGNRRDYDKWSNMGNSGWSFEEVFPYFLKAEDMRIPQYKDDPYHSTSGPITVEYFKYQHPITNDILEAGKQLGYEIRDVNGEFQTGFTKSHATVRDGLRCSTAKAYLRPASKRPNLHISINTFVEKVLIDGKKRAYGVKVSKKGQERIVRANREVILSAGSIQSPQLLMLSGIGPAQHLEEIGIHPIVDSPGVGQNLQDHVAMGGHSYLFDNPNDNGTDYCFNLLTVMSVGNLIDFAVHRKGNLYSMMEAEAMAFVKSKYADPYDDYPDVQLFVAPTADNLDGGIFGKRANGLTDDTYAELYEDILYDSSFSIIPLLLRPKSRGYLKLRDSSPFSSPLIYPNYFSHPDDMKIMVEGARIVQALTEQPALKRLNTRPNPNRNPGCVDRELMSDEHLECQARHHTLTIYHPVGTCAMGPASDPNAVVDPRLRVYGVKSLRVVDGSVMPEIVSGNTNAPIVMIAEKAADVIKEDWQGVGDHGAKACTPVRNEDHVQRDTEKVEVQSQGTGPDQRPLFDAVKETMSMFSDFALPELKDGERNTNSIKSDSHPATERRSDEKDYENVYENRDGNIRVPHKHFLPDSKTTRGYNPSVRKQPTHSEYNHMHIVHQYYPSYVFPQYVLPNLRGFPWNPLYSLRGSYASAFNDGDPQIPSIKPTDESEVTSQDQTTLSTDDQEPAIYKTEETVNGQREWSVLTPSQTIYCIIGSLRGLPRRRFGITGSGTLEHASSRAWYLLNPRCDTYRWAYRVFLDKPTNMSSD